MRKGETGRRMRHPLCGDFKVKHLGKKTACDGCGVSGLQCYYYRAAAVDQGANEAEGEPGLTVAPDYGTPLIINFSAPLRRSAALFRICLCERLHYSPKPSHSITHTLTVCV